MGPSWDNHSPSSPPAGAAGHWVLFRQHAGHLQAEPASPGPRWLWRAGTSLVRGSWQKDQRGQRQCLHPVWAPSGKAAQCEHSAPCTLPRRTANETHTRNSSMHLCVLNGWGCVARLLGPRPLEYLHKTQPRLGCASTSSLSLQPEPSEAPWGTSVSQWVHIHDLCPPTARWP